MNEDWVPLSRAHKLVGRSRRTVYRWVQEGLVETLRPLREVWVSVPDLMRVEAEKVQLGRPRHGSKEVSKDT